jgi:lipopolysaccharide export system protein LptA
MMIKRLALAAALCALGLAAFAEDTAPKPSGLSKNSKEPIAIEADSLEVFDKEQRAIYTGNVIVTQGETVMKAKKMVIYYDKPPEAATASTASPSAGPDADTSLRRVEANGDVVIIDKDQIATGDAGVYENATDTVTLTGNVALSKGQNVTKGAKLVYNLGTGVANVEAGASGRVSSSFTSSDKPKSGAAAPVPPTKTPKQ